MAPLSPPSRGPSRFGRRAVAAAIAAVAICLVLTGFFYIDIDWQALQRLLLALDPIACIAIMALLPVAGFSIGIVYLVAGAKFGPAMGGLVIAGATACHLVLTHMIARGFLRERLVRWFSRSKHRLPEIPASEEKAISALAALVPGLPYFARNYLLALSGVPLRIYFWICLPIYVARSYITILLGDLTSDPSGTRLGWLIGVYLLKLAICGILIRWLLKRHAGKDGDPPAPGA